MHATSPTPLAAADAEPPTAAAVGWRWIGREALREACGPVVRREALEHWTSGRSLLAEAQATAARLEADCAAQRAAAWQEGHAIGLAQGRAEAAREVLLQAAARVQALQDLKPLLIDAVLGSLRHLLAELPPDARLAALAPRVLGDVLGAQRVRLVVAPADAAAAQTLLQDWQRRQPTLQAVDVCTDDTLQRGDCLIETERDARDARIEARLGQLAEALARHLAETLP